MRYECPRYGDKIAVARSGLVPGPRIVEQTLEAANRGRIADSVRPITDALFPIPKLLTRIKKVVRNVRH